MMLQGESGESWFIGLFCLPTIWIASIIMAIVFSYKNRKTYFQKSTWLYSIILILFCTPVPIGFIHAEFFESDTYQAESDTIARNDFSLMHEEWVYRSNNKMAVDKYYRTQGNTEDISTYKRDSIWTYFDSSGDTIKIEKYDNGKLVSTIKKKQ